MNDSAKPRDKGRILVVDDNEDNLDILSRRLVRRGYSVFTAMSGESALEMIAEPGNQFDLILLDVMMPGIDGFEALRRIRKEHSPSSLPVILVTAKNQSEDITEGLRSGANDYITKPLDFPVLFARVRNHVDLAKSHRDFRLTQQLLIDAAKTESIGYLAAGVAHEIRNPLAQLKMGIDYLKDSSGAGAAEETTTILETMADAVSNADEIITNLMHFSQRRNIKRERSDLSELALTCLRILSDSIESAGIEVVSDCEAANFVDIDMAQMETAILNVLTNAVQAMPNGGELSVSTGFRELDESEVIIDEGVRSGNELRPGDRAAILTIADSGPGIPKDRLSKVFDAFFTDHATGGGAGLGLTVAKRITDLHGGMLRVENRSSRSGVRVTFILPSEVGMRTSV